MPEDLFVELIKYGISRGVHLAVDMYRNHTRRVGFDLLEELEDGCCFSGARWAETKSIYRPPALQCGVHAEFEAIHLCFTVEKMLGQMI